MTNQTYLSRTQAAAFIRDQGLPCARATLEKLASVGGGPKYRKFGGRSVYVREDLQDWIDERLSAPVSHAGGA